MSEGRHTDESTHSDLDLLAVDIVVRYTKCIQETRCYCGMLKFRRIYRQTFCHVSWHVKLTVGALLPPDVRIANYVRCVCLA